MFLRVAPIEAYLAAERREAERPKKDQKGWGQVGAEVPGKSGNGGQLHCPAFLLDQEDLRGLQGLPKMSSVF